MANFYNHILEALKIKSGDKKIITYKYFPEDKQELKEIILDLSKNCDNKILDLSEINTSKIKDFKELFYPLSPKVEIIDITGWDTSKAISFHKMFYNCAKLKEVRGLENLNVSNVFDFSGMFYKCKNIKTINISNWKTDELQYIRSMFGFCEKLETIDGIENININKLKDMWAIFSYCSKLKLNLHKWKIGRNVDFGVYNIEAPNVIGLQN